MQQRVEGPDDVSEDVALYFQRCQWCHSASYRRLLCPICGSDDLKCERSSKDGVIRRHGAHRRRPDGSWIDAVIDMAEGFSARFPVISVEYHRPYPGARVHLATAARTAGGDAGTPRFAFRVKDEMSPRW
jgi:uncharacterized OB-fold protein